MASRSPLARTEISTASIGTTATFKLTVATRIYSDISHTCRQGSLYTLTLGTDGRFYGVASSGGTFGEGYVYSMTTAGKITVLHNFNSTDGEFPVGNLGQASEGNFYGVTQPTPTNTSAGEIYTMTPSGTVTALHTFAPDGWEGENIVSGLLACLRWKPVWHRPHRRSAQRWHPLQNYAHRHFQRIAQL